MDSLDLLRTFREVAHRRGFAAAARALDMSPANVSKYVVELETRFRVRLFHRTTRNVSLTDAGRLLYERSGSLVDLFNSTEGEMLDRATHPSGGLTLTAPHGVTQTVLMQMLGQFMERNPDVSLHLRLTNRVVDMVEDGVDLAFRLGPIADTSLIVRRLLPIKLVVVATPAYWREHGRPRHPQDLSQHRLLALTPPDQRAHWHFLIRGRTLDLPLEPALTATDSAPLVALARSGLGVTRHFYFWMRKWIELGELEPLFGEYSPHDLWLHATYAQRHNNSAALNALLDFLEAEMPRYRIGAPDGPISFLT